MQCPDPDRCPVVDPDSFDAPATVTFDPGTPMVRVYDSTWGYDEFNPGVGDTRFAPFDDAGGASVPTMYLAWDRRAALLETVFHDINDSSERVVHERVLRERLLATVATPDVLTVVDLRDTALERYGVGRAQLVSSPPEHYPCTRRVAAALHARLPDIQGLCWSSRIAELTGDVGGEVLVVFGDRFTSERGRWIRVEAGAIALAAGHGRRLVDQIATELGATVIPDLSAW